jgi:hypothetical protein
MSKLNILRRYFNEKVQIGLNFLSERNAGDERGHGVDLLRGVAE